MIYDDRPLAQEGVKTSKLSGKWDPQSLSSKYVPRVTHDTIIILTFLPPSQWYWCSDGGSVP